MRKLTFTWMILIITILLSSISYAEGRATYGITQLSKNSIKVVLNNNLNQKVRITAYKKYSNDTVNISYVANSQIEKKEIIIDLLELKLDLGGKRFPNIILTEDGKENLDIFNDLPTESEYKIAILNLYNRGIISGYPDLTFRPDSLISREEFSAIFAKLLPSSNDETDINIFKDIEQNRWSKGYINLLVLKGIIKGKGNGEFKPSDNITLAEVSTITDRAYTTSNQNSGKNYKHLAAQHWANQSVSNMLDDGILNTEDTFYKNYNLEKMLTRAECVIILNRVLESYKILKS